MQINIEVGKKVGEKKSESMSWGWVRLEREIDTPHHRVVIVRKKISLEPELNQRPMDVCFILPTTVHRSTN